MIKVFVGCAPGDDLESQAVLEYSLRRHAAHPDAVAITWMQLSKDTLSPFYADGPRGWQTQGWSTPFSGFRWLVPSLCGFTGRAIYMDSDVILRADIAELWNQSLPSGKAILAKGGRDSWRFCVSLFDCAAAGAHLPPVAKLHEAGMHRQLISRFARSAWVAPFCGHWNCIDGEDFALDDPGVKLIHYSNEATQPQLRHAIPRLARAGRKHWFDGAVKAHPRTDLVQLFESELAAAKAAGYAPENYQPARPFGAYPLLNHKQYTENPWIRRQRARA